MPNSAANPWFEALKASGWKEVVPFVEFRQGHRTIIFDTSSWMELYNARDSRIADVPIPEDGREEEALILIEQLFAAENAAAK